MSHKLPLPPTPGALTAGRALGPLLQQRSPLGALELFQQDLGDIFRLNLPGFQPIIMAGPEACRLVMITQRKKLLWRVEPDPVVKLLRRGVLVQDGPAHDRLRRHMQPALHRRMLGGYVATMWQATDEVSATWPVGQPVDMLAGMRRVALLILMRTLFKVDFSRDMERLWPAILRILDYISPGWWLLWRGIPRPGYRAALHQMDRYLYRIIRARRANIGQADDLLGLLVSTPGLDDGLIRDQLLTMLIAGHDTSTALLAWTLYLLGRHPPVLARVQAEVEAALGNEPPTPDRLDRLPYLEQVIQESLRLYPPIHAGMRRAAADLEFQGYRIPAGARVLFSIYLTHRQPRYWPQPHRFDPDRFTPARQKERPPYVYVPFGTGPRTCIGYAFAQVETKVVLARLLQTFNWQAVPARVHPHMGATLEPRPQVLMRLHPI